MALDVVALLLSRLTARGGKWPPPTEVRIWGQVRGWRAILENDRDRLKVLHKWTDDEREYRVDPLAGRIADARADYLWGEDPVIAPAADQDANLLEALIDGQDDLVGTLHEAERRIGGESEQWWRAYVDRDIADVPLLEWHGRDSVIPVYVGRRLMGAALYTTLPRPGDRGPYWRHFEVHTDELVTHLLFRGQKGTLGTQQPLSAHEDTAGLAELLGEDDAGRAVWEHGLPMLMGRLVNRRKYGNANVPAVSDFDAIQDFLLGLNEIQTIGHENMRLTAKKRVVVPAGAVTPPNAGPGFTLDLEDRGDGVLVPRSGSTFDAGEDVFVIDPVDQELGKSPSSPFQVLEYSFDAEPLIAWKRDQVETALTRVGMTPQWVGTSTDEAQGLALTGTALRFKLIPTTTAGRRWARPWDGNLGPVILTRLAMLDALGEEDGGFGRDWARPDEPFTVERANPLPTDELEDATVNTQLAGARLRSRYQAVKAQHPDWDDEQINAELALIDADAPAPTSALGGLGLA